VSVDISYRRQYREQTTASVATLPTVISRLHYRLNARMMIYHNFSVFNNCLISQSYAIPGIGSLQVL